jgi:hypothetical protein
MAKRNAFKIKLDNLQRIIDVVFDCGIYWTEGDPQNFEVCPASEIESTFKKFVKKNFHKTVPAFWSEGFYTFEINDKLFHATRFSYLIDNPNTFQEMDFVRDIESVTESYTKKMPHPCIICEDRTGGWSDANSVLPNPRAAFEQIATSLEDNAAYRVDRINENLFYVYSKQKPYWAVFKYSLVS